MCEYLKFSHLNSFSKLKYSNLVIVQPYANIVTSLIVDGLYILHFKIVSKLPVVSSSCLVHLHGNLNFLNNTYRQVEVQDENVKDFYMRIVAECVEDMQVEGPSSVAANTETGELGLGGGGKLNKKKLMNFNQTVWVHRSIHG